MAVILFFSSSFLLVYMRANHTETCAAVVRGYSTANFGSPAILGSFVAIERRGGIEDPWLCVPEFSQVCLFQTGKVNDVEWLVNSGM
jgi:hypothetical protein